MNREKINDYIAEMQDQSGDYILRNWQRNAIADYCIEHETDLLKEFVVWLKDRFDKRIDEQTAKYERINNEGDDGTYLTSYEEYVANNEGILTGFVNAKWWLEELDTIEKFMEERKK